MLHIQIILCIFFSSLFKNKVTMENITKSNNFTTVTSTTSFRTTMALGLTKFFNATTDIPHHHHPHHHHHRQNHEYLCNVSAPEFLELEVLFDYNKYFKHVHRISRKLTTPVVIFGIISNVLTLLTLRQPELKTAPYTYLTALAVADLIALLITLPKEIIMREDTMAKYTWLVNMLYIHIYYPVMNMAAVSGIWIMVLMTVERCVITQFPLWAYTNCCTNYKARIKVMILVVAAISINIPCFFDHTVAERYCSYQVNMSVTSAQRDSNSTVTSAQRDFNSTDIYMDTGSTTHQVISNQFITKNTDGKNLAGMPATTELPAEEVYANIITWSYCITPETPFKYTLFGQVLAFFTTCFVHYIPLLALMIFNIFLVIRLRSQQLVRQRELGVQETTRKILLREQTRMTKTYIAIVFVFLILVMPSTFSDTSIGCYIFPCRAEHKKDWEIGIYQVLTNFLSILNLSVNFLLYSIINANFLKAFKRMLKQWSQILRLNNLCSLLLPLCRCQDQNEKRRKRKTSPSESDTSQSRKSVSTQLSNSSSRVSHSSSRMSKISKDTSFVSLRQDNRKDESDVFIIQSQAQNI